MDFNLGWYAHPIFKDGKYPEVSAGRRGEGTCPATGDATEDRQQERGPGLPGVQTAPVHQGGAADDPWQQVNGSSCLFLRLTVVVF